MSKVQKEKQKEAEEAPKGKSTEMHQQVVTHSF